jgi:hypothetical protein
MRIVHNSLAVFYLSIFMLFALGTACASEFNDPCQHTKAEKAQMAELGHSHWYIQCPYSAEINHATHAEIKQAVDSREGQQRSPAERSLSRPDINE